MNTQKAEFRNSTRKERAKFFLHESGNRPAALLLTDHKRFQLPGNGRVKNSRIGAAWSIFKRSVPHAAAQCRQQSDSRLAFYGSCLPDSPECPEFLRQSDCLYRELLEFPLEMTETSQRVSLPKLKQAIWT
jgi:hypothetical protein